MNANLPPGVRQCDIDGPPSPVYERSPFEIVAERHGNRWVVRVRSGFKKLAAFTDADHDRAWNAAEDYVRQAMRR